MEKISLEIQNTKSDAIIKFVANHILTSGSYDFKNINEATSSPLAQQLFYLPFVKRIFISANFIAIECFSTAKWEDVQEAVKEQIENYLNSGEVIINEPNKAQKKSSIEVYAESTPNPSVLKFVTNKLLVETDYEFKSKEEAIHAPLVLELFEFPFVKEVFLSQNYVSVVKHESVNWQEITNELRSFIKNYLASSGTLVSYSSEKETTSSEFKTNTEKVSEISQQIIAILDEYVKPAVAADGGNIAFQSFNETTKTVNVILQGACNGCPSSTITLKNGIENMLKQLLPGKVKQVVALNN